MSLYSITVISVISPNMTPLRLGELRRSRADMDGRLAALRAGYPG